MASVLTKARRREASDSGRMAPLPTNNFIMRPYLVPRVFSAAECAELVAAGNALPTRSGLMASASYKKRECKIATMRDDPAHQWAIDRVMELIDLVNAAWYRFDVVDQLEGMQFTRYAENGMVDWHPDTGDETMSTRKISITIQLSKPSDYEGGLLEFAVMGEMNDCRDQGSVIIFPSYLIHRVTPVTRGTRYSLVGWRRGPPFR